ncbi:AAA family ATPase [Escherichia coli]|uniref:AAA family ATPase n=1 Tax=Escherichia coli TaxID=562 RepID=UPI0013AB3155|nr:AAA family ATPase [Escherichia coli]EIL3306031.1 AAA family ATPase [Escherichia coli]EIN4528008.1 AAA family ATPase [Escherichia coli]EJE7976945.1 AAA family ATPase [Escherichia coli]MXF44565.1 AAA family ATPase [Escherichia coli]NUL87622.1 AAA family ATPase [Escherichia coli]
MSNQSAKMKKYKVIFSSENNILNNENVIYIYPSNSNWNDFKYKTHALASVFSQGRHIFKGELLSAVLADDSNHQLEYIGIANRIGNKSDLTITDNSYFSLFPSIRIYRNLVRDVGVDEAMKILHSLNDIVYISEYERKSKLLKEALKSDVFQKSFMRNAESFFAFNHAADIFRGLDFEELNYISHELKLKFSLDGFNNFHEIDLKFKSDGIIPKRINIFIGENGLGKSQALNHFVKAALQLRGFSDCLHDISNGHEQRPMINRLLAIGTPGETSNTYPSDSIKNPKLYYRRLLLTRNGRHSIGKSLVQLARMDESIKNMARWDIFIEAISIALPIDNIVIPLSNAGFNVNSIPLTQLKNSWNEEKQLDIWSNIEDNVEPRIAGDEGVYPMSSGQLSYFKFALLACLYIENGSFVLLDEPETHLHPKLISDFVTLLDNILERTGSFAIIATHSVYFVREVTREQVHVFKRDANKLIHILSPRLKTFGANIGDISYFVFEEGISNSLSKKIVKKANETGLKFQEIKSAYADELPTEMLQEIKMDIN